EEDDNYPIDPNDRFHQALRKNVLARHIVLEGEVKRGLEELFDDYVASFEPQLPVEFDLIEELVTANWRMHRVWAMETDMMEKQLSNQTSEDQMRCLTDSFSMVADSPGFTALSRHEARLQRTFQRALRSLLLVQEKRRNQSPAR